MPSTAGSVMGRAGSHLNDPSQLVYTTAVLLPYYNSALEEVEGELRAYGLNPLYKDSIIIEVPLGSIVLPEIPVDFVDVINLYERNAGSNEPWKQVTEVLDIDNNYTNGSQINQWTARGTAIQINPPTTDRDVFIEYVRGPVQASSGSTAVDIETSRHYLALLTARNAALDAGNSPSKAATYDERINRARDRFIRPILNASQSTRVARRRPFRGRGY